MQDKYIAKLIHCKSLDEFVTMFFGLSMCKKLSVLGDDVPVPKGTIFYRARKDEGRPLEDENEWWLPPKKVVTKGRFNKEKTPVLYLGTEDFLLPREIGLKPNENYYLARYECVETFKVGSLLKNRSIITMGLHKIARVVSPIRKITTEEIRSYLSEYQKINNCSKVTVDNIRRNISSFFSWLEEEDYILKSPMRRIHKIKTKQPVKEIISDEAIERLRDNCKHPRDRAMIDLLYSTGIRVGELVNLNRDDIDFEARECVVYGKGDKERRVYFDAKAKLHMKEYLESRTDDNPALFVTLDSPYNRLKISGVEIRIRELGRRLHLTKIHPHKFRRTMATRAIDKGMPIEQVQKILGHSQIDTTMQYAIVNQGNVKASHQRYIA